MVRLAPRLSPLFILRETIPTADEYRPARSPAPTSTPAPLADRLSSTDGPQVCPRRSPCCPTGDPPRPAPRLDPLPDADALEELEEEITILAAHIHAATHRLLALIAEFDRRRGWELGGHRSCAHWLSFRTGIDLGAAREKIRAARALGTLPRTSASMARGELSFSKVRALTRVATPDNEGDLVELARGCTTAQLERMVRAFRRGTRKDEAAMEREHHERRSLSVFPDEDGMYLVRGRLPAEIGALLMRAVEAASDALFREEMEKTGGATKNGNRRTTMEGRLSPEAHPADNPQPRSDSKGGAIQWVEEAHTMFPRPDADSEKRAAQRRADALGLLAEQALAAGFENGPVSGSRATRYQVVLHVEPDALRDPDAPGIAESAPGPSELEDGTRVSAETSRRIACDAGLVRVTHAPRAIDPAQNGIGPISEGTVLDVGRKTRTIPPAIRRALEVRDRGCRFPGCGSRFTDAHHVKHWADGGETSLDNCLLLCRHHHRLVHEGGWRVDWWGRGRPVFFDPRGGTHFEGRWRRGREGVAQPEGGGPMWLMTRPSVEEGRKGGTRPTQGAEGKVAPLMENNRPRGVTPDGGDGVETFVRENLLRDVKPDPWTASARWRREADIPDEIYFRGLEAIQEAVP